VKAINVAGPSLGSTSSDQIMAATKPNAPTDLTVDSASSTSITLSWTAPYNGGATITDYQVQWDDTGSYTTVKSTTLGLTTVDIVTSDGLTAGKSYNFKVLAQNFIGDSSLSSSEQAIAASEPDAPTLNIASTTATQTQITLAWNAPAFDGGSAITDYEVWWDRGTSSWE